MKTVRTLSWCWKDCGGHVPFHFLWWECKLVHREVHLAYLTVFECAYILHASKSIFKNVPYRNTSMNPWRCIYERMSDTDFLLLSEKIGINPGVPQLGRTIEQSHIIWIWGSFFFCACRQGFSNASVQQNPLEGLLKQIAGPCPHSVCGLGWSCRICISNSSQVMLQVPKCGHTLRTTDTERNEKNLLQVWPNPDQGAAQRQRGLGRDPGVGWGVPSDFPSTGPKPPSDHSEHGPGKRQLDSLAHMNARTSYRVGLSCGQREGAACGLASPSKLQGWDEGGGQLGDFCQLCLLVFLLFPGKLAFWFQGQHQMLGE